MLNNQRMDSADQRALLVAALGRTLAAAAAAGINDPKLAELLATGREQFDQLAAGHTGPDVRRPVPGAGRDGCGPYIVTISGADEDQCVRRETLLEARCAVDGAALLAGLTARDCRCDRCDGSDPHGTLVDDDGCIAALFDIVRERP
jgi:hypothetical protein